MPARTPGRDGRAGARRSRGARVPQSELRQRAARNWRRRFVGIAAVGAWTATLFAGLRGSWGETWSFVGFALAEGILVACAASFARRRREELRRASRSDEALRAYCREQLEARIAAIRRLNRRGPATAAAAIAALGLQAWASDPTRGDAATTVPLVLATVLGAAAALMGPHVAQRRVLPRLERELEELDE